MCLGCSAELPLRDAVHPDAGRLVVPPAARLVPATQRRRHLCHRDPRAAPLLLARPLPQTLRFLRSGQSVLVHRSLQNTTVSEIERGDEVIASVDAD